MVAKRRKAAAKAPRKKVDSVEGYLAAEPAGARAALLKLRKTIQAAAPEATEDISYQVPTFKQNGGLVAYAAFPEHCSFFVMSTEVMRAHAAELDGYPVGKGSIRFSPDEPLPATLVKKLVKARIAENEARGRSKRR
jgi:uncharacterized protein YdhG (YjbR/CyaY superfamily)